eukprot:1195695-Prorocentrum_minimum.AAC.7
MPDACINRWPCVLGSAPLFAPLPSIEYIACPPVIESVVHTRQVHEQEQKREALVQEEQAEQDKCDLIRRTLAPLQKECEKLTIIVQGFAN